MLPGGEDPGPDGLRAVRVGELLPDGFEAYVRLFHPFRPWDSASDEMDEARLRTWRSVADEANAEFGPQLTWGSLAPALPLDPEGRSRPLAVDEGTLHPVVRRSLLPILTSHTSAATCHFYFGLSAIVGAEGGPVLLEAPIDSLESVCELARTEGWASESPEYIWPDGRNWVLCSDYDLSSTYLACGADLANAIEAEPRLETIAVSLDTRVDNRADGDEPA